MNMVQVSKGGMSGSDVVSENTYSYTDPDKSASSSRDNHSNDRVQLPSNEGPLLPHNNGRSQSPINDRLARLRSPSNKEPTATMISREMRADLAARNESLGRDDSVEFSLVDADRDIFSQSFSSSADSLEQIEVIVVTPLIG